MGFFSNVLADLRAIRQRDPAVTGWAEAFLCYPGFHALVTHRFSHFFYRLGLRLIPRLINTWARFMFAVDIHPGATIGKGIFIDHAHGVVIGETAIVKDNVTILHQVTLGGTGKDTGKRHPTVEEGVLIGAGAKILGNITIGKNSKIGSASVVVRDIPPNCTVVGNPGRIVRMEGEKVPSQTMDSANLPDPIQDMIRELEEAIKQHRSTEIASLALPKVIGEVPRDVLKEICDNRRTEVKELKKKPPAEKLSGRAGAPPRDFYAALKRPGVSLIAEFKRKSPSAGDIRPGADPREILKIYEQSGASAASVLTETKYFGGSLDDLAAVRSAVSIPILRKDFIVDEWQILETFDAGADAILLIVAALTDEELRRFLQKTHGFGMSALVEAHNAEELRRALDTGAKIIGVNARDLRTMTTDIDTVLNLAKSIPPERKKDLALVAESGIKTNDDIIRLGDAGFNAVLIGETFMKADDIGVKVKELMGGKDWAI